MEKQAKELKNLRQAYDGGSIEAFESALDGRKGMLMRVFNQLKRDLSKRIANATIDEASTFADELASQLAKLSTTATQIKSIGETSSTLNHIEANLFDEGSK